MNKVFDFLKNTGKAGVEFVKDKKPEIFLIAGAGCTAASVYLAGKNSMEHSLNIHKLYEEKQKNIENIKDIKKGIADKTIPSYTRFSKAALEDKFNTRKISCKISWELIKIYRSSIITMLLGIAFNMAAYRTLKKRLADTTEQLATATATLGAVYEAFNAYRGRVKNKYGEEVENEIYYDLSSETVTVSETDENGKTKKEKKTIHVPNSDFDKHLFSFKFTPDTSDECIDQYDYDISFLKQKMSAFNTEIEYAYKTNQKKFIFLNDALKAVGIKITKPGQMFGKFIDPENDEVQKKIDFGITVVQEKSDSYVNGYKDIIVLNFNTDELLIDKL